MQGEWDRAGATLAEALRSDPGNLKARYLRAKLLHQQSQWDDAARELEQVARAAPGCPDVWVQLAIVLNDGNRERPDMSARRRRAAVRRALAALDRAEGLTGPGDHMVHLQRGIVLCFAGRFEEAGWDLWKAVEAAPMDGNAYWDIAWLEAQRGDGAAAASALRFAARDPRLFAMRVCQQEVLNDEFLRPVVKQAAFLSWARQLPVRCAVREGH